MKDVVGELESMSGVADKLRRIDEQIVSVRPRPDKWSRKEILSYPACLRNSWRSPDGNDVDLELIIRDDIVHMRHHLDQIVS